jgi:hypothetical protein
MGASIYNDFDASIDGPGFPAALAAVSVDTTKGSTSSSAWDQRVGASCPGALQFAAQFMEYVSEEPDERAYGSLHFTASDWSGAAKLHVMVRLAPANAPISEVRLFVMSGDDYLYRATSDTANFLNGEWNEMVLPLDPDPSFDATKAFRVGVQLTLSRAGTAGIPDQPPTIHFWLDDIWLEPS